RLHRPRFRRALVRRPGLGRRLVVPVLPVRRSGRWRLVVPDRAELRALRVDPLDDRLRAGVGRVVTPAPATWGAFVALVAVHGKPLCNGPLLSALRSTFVTHRLHRARDRDDSSTGSGETRVPIPNPVLCRARARTLNLALCGLTGNEGRPEACPRSRSVPTRA